MPNWTYDKNDYDPNGHFELIPPGDYRCRIEEAEETRSKASNKDMFKLTLTISGHKGKLWFYVVFPEPDEENFNKKKQMTNQKLGEIWESFNLTVGDMNVLNWRGKVGAARLKQCKNDRSGDMENQVSFFLTRKRQEDLPAWQEPGGNSASAAPGVDSMSMRAESSGDMNLPF